MSGNSTAVGENVTYVDEKSGICGGKNLVSLDGALLQCFALHCRTVITVILHYYTVGMHDVGNRNTGQSAAKSRGNIGEFHSARDTVVTLLVVLDFLSGKLL